MLNSPPAFLLIHGFGGDVAEIAPLADVLENSGFKVVSTKLAGHTNDRHDLKNVSRYDWVDSAEKDLLSLMPDYENIILIGFSTGGLIAANLAGRYTLAAIITINTPIFIWNIRRILSNLLKDIRNKKAESFRWYLYSAVSFPLSALIQFKLLLQESRPIFAHLSCPIFVLQGQDDDTVHFKSGDFIYSHAASEVKEIHLFQESGHVMLAGPASKEAIQKILSFVERL